MALRSIKDADYSKPTTVEHVEEAVQGQKQTERKIADGKVDVRETRIQLDTQIVDPHHELAVQVPPEGSTVGIEPPLAFLRDAKTPEQVFAEEGKSESTERKSTRSE